MDWRRRLLTFVICGMLLSSSGRCWGSPPPGGSQLVCSIISNPHRYANQRISVRGLIIYPTGDAAPPPLVTGNCKYGIPIFEGDPAALKKSEGYKELLDAVWKPLPSSGRERHIWATMHGILRVEGNRFHLELLNVTDVMVRPFLTVEWAEIPHYPSAAATAGISGTVRIRVTVKSGKVAATQVLSHGDQSLESAAIQNVRTWEFPAETTATFDTTYVFKLAIAKNWPPPDNPVIELRLPATTIITHLKRP